MGAGPRIKCAEQCGTASDFHLAAENERSTQVCLLCAKMIRDM
jgi:hypothetical protein